MMRADRQNDELADLLRAEAASFAYPPTPDLTAAVRARLAERPRRAQGPLRLVPGLALALAAALLLVALLAVPEVRAAALRLLRVGAVTVQVEPAPAPLPPPTALPATPEPSAGQQGAAAPPRAVDLVLAGETTLAEARRRAGFPILLPAYPEGLGPPQRVFLQDLAGDAVVLVWADPQDPGRATLSLHALRSPAFAEKTIFGEETERLAEAEVGGAPALWVRGPHLLRVGSAGREEIALMRIVDGNTLIWTRGDVTYRLECDVELDEALRIAESLR